MEDSIFTPGPWMERGQFVITGNEVGPIDAHNREDALLIAAAPELLDALKWLHGCAHNYMMAATPKERDWYRPDVAHALLRAGEAINKAKGR